MNPLYQRPEVLAFLQGAKEYPDDDTPRLILADWLEDHDDAGRAEFIRLQCRLASTTEPALRHEQRQAAELRVEELLDRLGGAWAGPLWAWRPTEYAWRRGLLGVRLARPAMQTEHLEDVLPWIDALHVEIHGWKMLQRCAELLNSGTLNHVGLTLRRFFPESALLDCLGRVRESPCLRSLMYWCVRPSGRRSTGAQSGTAALRPGEHFLTALVRELPLGRHLTYLGLGPRLTPQEATLIRGLGVEPLDGQSLDWLAQPLLRRQRSLRRTA